MSNELPLDPVQAMINGMSAAWQAQRSQTQMTLGGLIEALEKLPPEATVHGIGEPMSYRGYYRDLAFEPSRKARPAAAVLADCRAAMGEVFEGYKGGDYVMGRSTPVWSAYYSCCGPRIMGLSANADGSWSPVLAEEE